jgi:hypothetical protein
MLNLSDKFSDRCDSIFYNQRNRAKEKKDKNGRTIKAGYVIPFDKKQFTAWFLDKFGGENNAILCRYCKRPIDAFTCQVDHAVPLKRGGPPALSNLDTICAPCNAIKGKMTPEEMEFFCALMIDMGNHFHNGTAVQDITHRLESYSKMKATVNAGRARKNAARVAAVVTGMNEEPF